MKVFTVLGEVVGVVAVVFGVFSLRGVAYGFYDLFSDVSLGGYLGSAV